MDSLSDPVDIVEGATGIGLEEDSCLRAGTFLTVRSSVASCSTSMSTSVTVTANCVNPGASSASKRES